MTRRLPILAAVAAAGTLGPAAGAEAAAPLLTVGVDATEASLDDATYEVLVVNHGDADAHGVEVATSVPANTTLVSADPATGPPCTPGAAAGTSCTWGLGTVPAGASRTITVVYALGSGTYNVSATATVSADDAASNSNTDTSLGHRVHAASDDTWVDHGEATNTNHGACDELRVGPEGTSAFLEQDAARPDLFSGSANTEVLVAELVAQVKTAVPGASIGAHRLVTANWSEGSGSCAGAAGAHPQPRTGSTPTAEGAATDVSDVGLAGQAVHWDVTADFDTEEKRRRFAGWELRGAAAGGTTVLHASEAAGDAGPTLTLITRRKTRGLACVDALVEDATAPSDEAQRIDVRVTDSGQRISNGEREACSGTPVAGRELTWNLFDAASGAPDGWFASVDGLLRPIELGAGGAAGPNAVASSSDAGGRTYADLRLRDPWDAADNSGTHRVDVYVAGAGTTDPDDPDCVPGETCPAENTQEDDVRRAWTPTENPPPVEEEPGNEQPPPEGDTTNPVGAGVPPGGSADAAPVARGVALAASSRIARAGRTVTLRGRVASAEAACAGPREYVEILRRRTGGTRFTDFASVSTTADGTFELPLRADASADYVAVVPEREGCLRAASAAVRIAVRPRLVVRARRKRAGGYEVVGRVVPAARGRVVLQRRSRGRWVPVRSTRTTSAGRFRFELRRLPRVWRVRWRSDGR
jgi:uncharacterized repeat protein (TIGR01451 family)